MSIDTPLTGAQFARDMFDHYVGKYNKAAVALRNSAERLPDFFDPESHTTDCDHIESLRVVEPGIERWETVESWTGSDVPGRDEWQQAVVRGDTTMGFDEWVADVYAPPPADPNEEKWMHARTGGYDAYGDEGLVSYLLCSVENGGCGLTWKMHEHVSWD